MYQHTFIYLFYFLISKEIKKKKNIYSKPSPTITRSYFLHVVVSVFRLSNAHLVHFVAMRSIALISEWKFPDVVNSNKTTKMSETQSVDTHDTSNDASDDPLLDLTGDQLFQLVEDTLYVKFGQESNNHCSSKSIYSHLHTWRDMHACHSDNYKQELYHLSKREDTCLQEDILWGFTGIKRLLKQIRKYLI